MRADSDGGTRPRERGRRWTAAAQGGAWMTRGEGMGEEGMRGCRERGERGCLW